MVNSPKHTPLIQGEHVLKSSGGKIRNSIIFFSEPKPLTRPAIGKVFLTNFRLIFEGHHPADRIEAISAGIVGALVLGPPGAVVGASVSGAELEFAIPYHAIENVVKHERIGRDLIHIIHNHMVARGSIFLAPVKNLDAFLILLRTLVFG